MVLVTQNTAHLSTSFNGNVIKLPTVGSMFVKYFQLTSHTFSKRKNSNNQCVGFTWVDVNNQLKCTCFERLMLIIRQIGRKMAPCVKDTVPST